MSAHGQHANLDKLPPLPPLPPISALGCPRKMAKIRPIVMKVQHDVGGEDNKQQQPPPPMVFHKTRPKATWRHRVHQADDLSGQGQAEHVFLQDDDDDEDEDEPSADNFQASSTTANFDRMSDNELEILKFADYLCENQKALEDKNVADNVSLSSSSSSSGEANGSLKTHHSSHSKSDEEEFVVINQVDGGGGQQAKKTAEEFERDSLNDDSSHGDDEEEEEMEGEFDLSPSYQRAEDDLEQYYFSCLTGACATDGQENDRNAPPRNEIIYDSHAMVANLGGTVFVYRHLDTIPEEDEDEMETEVNIPIGHISEAASDIALHEDDERHKDEGCFELVGTDEDSIFSDEIYREDVDGGGGHGQQELARAQDFGRKSSRTTDSGVKSNSESDDSFGCNDNGNTLV